MTKGKVIPRFWWCFGPSKKSPKSRLHMKLFENIWKSPICEELLCKKPPKLRENGKVQIVNLQGSPLFFIFICGVNFTCRLAAEIILSLVYLSSAQLCSAKCDIGFQMGNTFQLLDSSDVISVRKQFSAIVTHNIFLLFYFLSIDETKSSTILIFRRKFWGIPSIEEVRTSNIPFSKQDYLR
jgi:hypothetical protein